MVRFYIKKITIIIILKLLYLSLHGYGTIASYFCDFVAFNFNCMNITRVEFDNKYFEKLILKLNGCYEAVSLLQKS